jgi:hypothetical protein
MHDTPWGGHALQDWTDHDDRLTAEWLQHNGIFVSLEVAGQAVETVANEYRFHPVREYLCGLEWDGRTRVEDWLSEYLVPYLCRKVLHRSGKIFFAGRSASRIHGGLEALSSRLQLLDSDPVWFRLRRVRSGEYGVLARGRPTMDDLHRGPYFRAGRES